MMLGNFVVAFGCQQKWPWAAIVVIGFTCGENTAHPLFFDKCKY